MGSTAVLFTTGIVGTLEKSTGTAVPTFISQFLGGIWYFCKIFCNKKNA